VAESIFVTVIFPNVTLPGIVAPVKSTVPVNVLAPLIVCVPVVWTTVLSIATVPLEMSIPVPPVKWALTSLALGPVYVITPDVLLYANEPSPPESDTVIFALTFDVKSVICDAVISISVFVILPILPYLSAKNTGTALALP